jgi:hypothetical protein
VIIVERETITCGPWTHKATRTSDAAALDQDQVFPHLLTSLHSSHSRVNVCTLRRERSALAGDLRVATEVEVPRLRTDSALTEGPPASSTRRAELTRTKDSCRCVAAGLPWFHGVAGGCPMAGTKQAPGQLARVVVTGCRWADDAMALTRLQAAHPGRMAGVYTVLVSEIQEGRCRLPVTGHLEAESLMQRLVDNGFEAHVVPWVQPGSDQPAAVSAVPFVQREQALDMAGSEERISQIRRRNLTYELVWRLLIVIAALAGFVAAELSGMEGQGFTFIYILVSLLVLGGAGWLLFHVIAERDKQ